MPTELPLCPHNGCTPMGATGPVTHPRHRKRTQDCDGVWVPRQGAGAQTSRAVSKCLGQRSRGCVRLRSRGGDLLPCSLLNPGPGTAPVLRVNPEGQSRSAGCAQKGEAWSPLGLETAAGSSPGSAPGGRGSGPGTSKPSQEHVSPWCQVPGELLGAEGIGCALPRPRREGLPRDQCRAASRSLEGTAWPLWARQRRGAGADLWPGLSGSRQDLSSGQGPGSLVSGTLGGCREPRPTARVGRG